MVGLHKLIADIDGAVAPICYDLTGYIFISGGTNVMILFCATIFFQFLFSIHVLLAEFYCGAAIRKQVNAIFDFPKPKRHRHCRLRRAIVLRNFKTLSVLSTLPVLSNLSNNLP